MPANAPKPALKVLLCSPRGFCAGVVRAIESVERVLPDVTIVNVLLGNESELELLPRIKRLTPDSEVLVISEAAWEMASISASRADGSRARASRSAACLTSGPPASAAATRSRRRLSTYGVMSMCITMTSP